MSDVNCIKPEQYSNYIELNALFSFTMLSQLILKSSLRNKNVNYLKHAETRWQDIYVHFV